MNKFSILIVDDHKLFRRGLHLILQEIAEITECKEAENGEVFFEILKTFTPDIVFMDIQMPKKDGIETTFEALKMYPDLRIIAISMFSNEEFYFKMVDAGVKGFIQKNADYEELIIAIDNVLNGKTYFSNEILRNIISNFRDKQSTHEKLSDIKINFTEREKEVILYLCKGLSNNEIADKLYISNRTVDKYRASLLAKTESKNSIQFVIFAIKHNLININDL